MTIGLTYFFRETLCISRNFNIEEMKMKLREKEKVALKYANSIVIYIYTFYILRLQKCSKGNNLNYLTHNSFTELIVLFILFALL